MFPDHSSFLFPRFIVLVHICLAGFILPSFVAAQSVEVMPGTEYFFADVQFFKPLDKRYRSSFFNRTRVQLSYDDEVSFFTAGYLNYTTPIGLGPSLITRVSNGGGEVDFGAHYYRQGTHSSFFGLLSVSLTDEGVVSWFSIFRYSPPINEQWKVYSSVELFSVLRKGEHAASIQRLRLGLDYRSYQFGVGANLLEGGSSFVLVDDNVGVFVRKEF